MREKLVSLLPPERYFQNLSTMPVVCVDNVAYRVINGERRVLLAKRTQNPARGCLYPIGKGLNKNAFGRERALETIQKETGLIATIQRPFGFYEKMYAMGQNDQVTGGLHNPCIAFVTLLEGGDPRVDDTASAFRWFRREDYGNVPLPPYTQTLLEDSGVFSANFDPDNIPFHHRELDYTEVDFSKFVFND